MKNWWYMWKWWVWLLLAGAQIVNMVLNIFEGENGVLIGFYIATIVILAALGVVQYFCEKKGEAGNKLSNRLFIALIGLWILISIICLML